MSRRSKGPRLYLRDARPEKRQAAGWVIRDGAREVGTGCRPDQLAQAEVALAEYIGAKWTPAGQGAGDDRGRVRDPAEVLIADVLNIYAAEKAPTLADPAVVSYRLEPLLAFWTAEDAADGRDGTLAGIRRSTCAGYVAWRTAQSIRSYRKNPAAAPRVSAQSARRELEDLSAAIGWFEQEHPLTRRPIVTLPDKAESQRDALTRDQAARLLKAAMGWRWEPAGPAVDGAVHGTGGRAGRWTRLGPSARANRAHLRRFLMLGLYTGTRHAVLLRLLWAESPTSAWVDLDKGVIYRRGKAERDRKTKRRPLVRIPGRLLAHLRRWRRMDEALQVRLRQAHFDAGGDAATAPQLVSVLHHGSAPIAGKIRTGFQGIVADAGLEADVTPHWMRHTCATWLMEGDAQPWDAAGFMGMSMKTLEDTYGHHRPGHQAGARRAAGGRRRED